VSAAQLWALHDALERRTVVIEIVLRFTVGRRGGQLPARVPVNRVGRIEVYQMEPAHDERLHLIVAQQLGA
jgi:hypothetical protein